MLFTDLKRIIRQMLFVTLIYQVEKLIEVKKLFLEILLISISSKYLVV